MIDRKVLPKFRTENLVIKELDNEILIYDIERNTAFCLNQPARLVMESCDGVTPLATARTSIADRLENGTSDDLIWLAIDEFRKAELLEHSNSTPPHKAATSRREMIRNAAALGLAVPVIFGLVAPAAALVASCLPPNVPCTGVPPLCCPGLFCQSLEQGPTGSLCRPIGG